MKNTIFISLDTFKKFRQNIDSKLDAWLTFLGSDDPADIVKLVNSFPEFRNMYADIVEFRRHPKELMSMVSEALRVADRNTEIYMMDRMRRESEEAKKELAENKKELAENKKELAENKKELAENKKEIAESKKEIAENKKEIAENKESLVAAVAFMRGAGLSDDEIMAQLHLKELPQMP